jgi:hypothetical protein
MGGGPWKERLLFLLFLAGAVAMVVTGVLLEQVPQTLFNATII